MSYPSGIATVLLSILISGVNDFRGDLLYNQAHVARAWSSSKVALRGRILTNVHPVSAPGSPIRCLTIVSRAIHLSNRFGIISAGTLQAEV
jgi:hypothetical protein